MRKSICFDQVAISTQPWNPSRTSRCWWPTTNLWQLDLAGAEAYERNVLGSSPGRDQTVRKPTKNPIEMAETHWEVAGNSHGMAKILKKWPNVP